MTITSLSPSLALMDDIPLSLAVLVLHSRGELEMAEVPSRSPSAETLVWDCPAAVAAAAGLSGCSRVVVTRSNLRALCASGKPVYKPLPPGSGTVTLLLTGFGRVAVVDEQRVCSASQLRLLASAPVWGGVVLRIVMRRSECAESGGAA